MQKKIKEVECDNSFQTLVGECDVGKTNAISNLQYLAKLFKGNDTKQNCSNNRNRDSILNKIYNFI